MDDKTSRQRVYLANSAGAFVLLGVVLILIAEWENDHTSDGHHYWPFIDLFWLLILGCGLIVLAINALVWRRVIRNEPSKSSLVTTLVLLVVLSPGATILVGVLVLVIAGIVS